MPDIFRAGIAKAINKAFSPLVFAVILTKEAKGTRAVVTSGPTATSTTYAGKGFIDSYSDSKIDGNLIRVGDRMLTILGASMTAVPEPNDTANIEGKDWEIIRVARDPAGATYMCQVRG